MGFDTKAFKKAKFEDRTERVPVPDLAEWFEEGEEAVFVVRGLTGEELARCNEAARHNKNINSVVEAIAGQNEQEKIDALRETLGISTSVPDDLAKRMEQFSYGTVDPDMDHEAAVKFAQEYPIEFYQITNKIAELTGQGRQIVKKKNSKQEQTSG